MNLLGLRHSLFEYCHDGLKKKCRVYFTVVRINKTNKDTMGQGRKCTGENRIVSSHVTGMQLPVEVQLSKWQFPCPSDPFGLWQKRLIFFDLNLRLKHGLLVDRKYLLMLGSHTKFHSGTFFQYSKTRIQFISEITRTLPNAYQRGLSLPART